MRYNIHRNEAIILKKTDYVILSPRLNVIANKVLNNACVVDIGTDHAYIPIYLVKKGISSFAIASDVRKGPISKALNNVRKYGLDDKISVRLGNGLKSVAIGEVDTIIVAGMGGMLICDILSESIELLKTIKRIILQPMTGIEDVRGWLSKNDFKIIDEELVKDAGTIYTVIVAERGTDIIKDDIYYYIGERLIEKRDPFLKELLINRINELEKIIFELGDKTSKNAINRKSECIGRIERYKSIYGETI